MSAFLRDFRGAAAAEFVLILPVLLLPLVPMVDIGVFAVQRMQVDTASQSGAAAAWHLCDNPLEAANQTNCTGDLAAAVTAAIQSTNLGANVTLSSTPIVGYYCSTEAGTLIDVTATWNIAATTAPTKPTTCASAVSGSTTVPGQYIQVTVSAPYTPVFGALVTAGVLPATITRTSWRRIA